MNPRTCKGASAHTEELAQELQYARVRQTAMTKQEYDEQMGLFLEGLTVAGA